MSGKSGRKIRYAVVGMGHLAQVAILPAFKRAQNSELVALVSDDPEKRQVAKKYGLERTYSYEDYEKALFDVDAVYIVLPNHLHREYAVRAAQAHVHALCEKPMAVSEEDCEAMIDAEEWLNFPPYLRKNGRLHSRKSIGRRMASGNP
jgi:glucose-fructose oxidoreductase